MHKFVSVIIRHRSNYIDNQSASPPPSSSSSLSSSSSCFVLLDLEPDDERSVEVSVTMVGVIEPVEHVSSRSHGHVIPELRRIRIVTMSRLRLGPPRILRLFHQQLFQFETMTYIEASTVFSRKDSTYHRYQVRYHRTFEY